VIKVQNNLTNIAISRGGLQVDKKKLKEVLNDKIVKGSLMASIIFILFFSIAWFIQPLRDVLGLFAESLSKLFL